MEEKAKSKPISKSELKQTTEPKELSKLLLLVVAIASGFGGGWIASSDRFHRLESSAQTQREVISSESELISSISKEVGESVVSVNVRGSASARDFFGYTQEYEQESAGTGFILNKEGIVVTNRHVVSGNDVEVSVTLADGTELTDVEVVGVTNATDPLDIAFLRINDSKGKELKPVKLGKSAETEVGDRVIAIGNALGQFQNTVTSGIISGFGRSIEAAESEYARNSETLINLFQTDASINQGNSGGPLVNTNGEVIAINVAIAGGGAENIGFAIPIDDVRPLINSVLEKGKLERPYLGVRYVSVTADIAYTYNLPVSEGAYIVPSENGTSIVENSPASKAGLKEKDIITSIDGEPVTSKRSLVSILGTKSVGSEVTLTVLRDGNEQNIKVVLEAAPEQ